MPHYFEHPAELMEFFLSLIRQGRRPSRLVVKDGRLFAFSFARERFMSWEHVTQALPYSPSEMLAAVARIANLLGIHAETPFTRPASLADAVARIAYSGVCYPHKGLKEGVRKQEETALCGAIHHRAELFTRTSGAMRNIEQIDLSSAFPNAALSPLPVSQLYPARPEQDCPAGFRSLHRVWVDGNRTLDPQIAALPFNSSKGVVYPHGQFEAWVWDEELLAARQSGCHAQVKQTYFCRASSALARWMEKLISIRQKHPDLAPWAKLVANTAIGKIKARGDFWEYAIMPKDSEGWTPVNFEAGLFVRRKRAKRPPAHYCPQAWGYIQACVRAELLRQLMQTGEPYLCYADMVLGSGVDARPGWAQKERWGRALYAGRSAGTWAVLSEEGRYTCRWQGLSRDLEPGQTLTLTRYSGFEAALSAREVRSFEVYAPTMQELATEERKIWGRRTIKGDPKTYPIQLGASI